MGKRHKKSSESLDKVALKFINEIGGILKNATKKNNTKAQELLDQSLDYPSLTSKLPYRSYDAATNIFINESTLGWVLEVNPLIGANTKLVEGLDEFFRTKIPRNIPMQFTSLYSKEVKNILDYGLRNEKWKGDNADYFNEISSAYYQNAALNNFDNGRGYNLTLRNFRVFITFAVDRKGNLHHQINEASSSLKIIKTALEGAFLFGQPLNPNSLIQFIREISNVDLTSTVNSSDDYNENELINEQCIDRNTKLIVEKDHIKLTCNKKELSGTTESIITQYMISNNPNSAFLWNGANNIGSIMTPSLMISCPHVVTFIIEIQDQGKTSGEISAKYLDRSRKAEGKLGVLIPSLKKEATELNALREKLDGGRSSLCLYYYNVTVFSRNMDDSRRNEQDVLNVYRSNGIPLTAPDCMQFRNYLSMFPFMPHEDLWHDIKLSSGTNRSEVMQAVNLLPIIGDNKLANEGLLAPSFRNQISFINIFNLGTDNFNCALCGTAGAGKSVIAQSLLYDVYNNKGKIWVLDLGDSYKNFCEINGGKYIDATTLKFNPFSNISVDPDHISNQEEQTQLQDTLSQISKLICVMADPQDTYLDQVMEGIIFRGVQNAYYTKRNKARIDDVVDYFYSERDREDYKDKSTLKHKMDELAILLEKFTTRGIYGDYFNSDDPTVNEERQITVLELGGLQNTPDLLAVVLYSLMISIDEYMYQSPRSIMKVCAIDEAWRLLSGSKRVASFIEVGYRTARKHKGAFITITQGLNDFTGSKAAQAAWDNSSIKIIGKQDAIAIKTYISKNPNMFKPHQEQVLKTFGNASQQKFSSFLLSVGDDMYPCRLFLDPLRRTLFSSTGEDFDYIQKERAKGKDISTAIFERAEIKFPEELDHLKEWVKERNPNFRSYH